MQGADRVKVWSLFPFYREQYVMVQLDSLSLVFRSPGPVDLVLPEHRVHMRQTGSGLQNALPVLKLVSADPRYPTIEEIMALLGEKPPANLVVPADAAVERSRERQ